MRKVQKHALSLLEVVIATSIAAILLGVLWNTYYSWSKGYKELQVTQNRLHKTIFMKQRLELISTTLCSQVKENKVSFFHEKGKASQLHLTYKGGPDRSPEFNGLITSQIFLDEKGILSFITRGKQGTIRQEILQTGVSSIEFAFFNPKTNVWEEEWEESKEHLPLWIEIKIKTAKEEESFYLRSSLLKEPILYLEPIEGPI